MPDDGEACYFATFDLPERLDLAVPELEARYHALARTHHPDRFAARGPEAQAEAALRMEQVNRAYRTLRDPWERARYVLSRHGVALGEQSVPAELAMEYFELQEALGEVGDRTAAIAALTELRAALQDREAQWTHERDALAREHDALPADERPACRERLAALVGNLSYLRAMRRDLDTRLMAAGA